MKYYTQKIRIETDVQKEKKYCGCISFCDSSKAQGSK